MCGHNLKGKLRMILEQRDRELAMLEEERAALEQHYTATQREMERISRTLERLREAEALYAHQTSAVDEPDSFFEEHDN